MTPWAVAYLFTYCPQLSADLRWRLLLGLGALPAGLVAILSHYETSSKRKQQAQYMMHAAGLTDSMEKQWVGTLHPALRGPMGGMGLGPGGALHGIHSHGPHQGGHHPGGGGGGGGGSSNIMPRSAFLDSDSSAHSGSVGGSSFGAGGGGAYSNPPTPERAHHPGISASAKDSLRDSLGGSINDRSSQASNSTLRHSLDRELRNSSVGIGLVEANVVLLDAMRQWRYQKHMIATGGGWFLYDVAYYGVNLFGGAILAAIDGDRDDDNVTSNTNVQRVSGQELIALSMGLPACILTILLLKRAGTKTLQVYGFVLIAFMFILLAALFTPLKRASPQGLYAIYCFLLFSLSFGPNVTTYVLPAETYPKEVRATLNGISAAMGKLGAVAGASMFQPIATVTSYPVVMLICAVLAVMGAGISWWFIEERVGYGHGHGHGHGRGGGGRGASSDGRPLDMSSAL